MQEWWIHTTTYTRSYVVHVCPSPQVPRSSGKTVGGGWPAVPVSPGHVRRLHPYPPSCRRRQ